jgi:uncharacterized protein (TIGR02284 family)
VAADNVANPGMKVILKGYAVERARYASRLREERARSGLFLRLRWAPLATLHRGWMNVKAAMTLGDAGREQKVLRECLRGERKLLRAYGRAIRRNLPVKLHTDLLAQHARIRQVEKELRLLDTQTDARLLPYYFSDKGEAEQAVDHLRQAGFEPDGVSLTPLAQLIRSLGVERGRSHHIVDSALSAGLVGAILGTLGGVVVGGSIAMTGPGFTFETATGTVETVLATAAAGTGVGMLFGALLGSIIGIGVARESDDYLLAGPASESVLLTVRTKPQRVEAAWHILNGKSVQQAESTSEPVSSIAAVADSE